MDSQNTSHSTSILELFRRSRRAPLSPPPALPFHIHGVFTSLDHFTQNHAPAHCWSFWLLLGPADKAARCLVEEVDHFKGTEHDYLRFKVKHPKGDRKAYIFTRRTLPRKQYWFPLACQGVQPDFEVVWATERSRSYPPKRNFDGSPVRHMVFSDQDTFSVFELSTLLHVTADSCHRLKLADRIAESNWFCQTIWGMLGVLFPNVASSAKEIGIVAKMDICQDRKEVSQQRGTISLSDTHKAYLKAREEDEITENESALKATKERLYRAYGAFKECEREVDYWEAKVKECNSAGDETKSG